jgi:hypothetical protein
MRKINPFEDGITHINIYSKGRTKLGTMLSNFYPWAFDNSDGYFSSVEGYWYWLGIKDCPEKEDMRKLSGWQAKQKGRVLKEHFGEIYDDNFEYKILSAIWLKAKRYKHLFAPEYKMLPLEHYYIFGNKIFDVKKDYPWMIIGIEKMKNAIYEKIG